jgi:hypothetical protein
VDGLADLVEVAVAAVAQGEVVDEPLLLAGLEGALQEGRHQFDEFLAVEIVHGFASL